MRILDRYITRSFLLTFGITLAVVTFVMCIGLIFRVTDLLARGASWRLIARIFAYGIPGALSFATPVSLLTASLLVFGRMSADSEIVAMKSGGISTWQILSIPIRLSLLLTLVCVFINCGVAPKGRYQQRVAIKTLGIEASLDLLEEGRFVRDFSGLTVYVGRKEGRQIYDIIVYDNRAGSTPREVRAKSGTIGMSDDKRDLTVDLYDVRVDPFYEDRPGPGFCQKWPIRIPVDSERMRKIEKRDGDYTSVELLRMVMDPKASFPELGEADLAGQTMSLIVEFNKRLSMAAACMAFVLLGVPLGVRTHRKESSIGLAISLFLVLNFYIFLIVADSFSKRPEMYPYLFVWFPVVFSVVLGLYLVWRSR